MQEVTPRQKELLRVVVDEYIDSASPVGSEALVKKYKLKYSPATIRNEMADLIRKGFLEMPHSSSGRKPTSLGLRYYITELMEEQDVPVLNEVAIKQRIWQDRYEFEKLLRNITLALAESTKHLSVVSLTDGFVIHAGSVNILDYPEFFDMDVAKAALNLLDNFELLNDLLSKGFGDNDIKVLIGKELNFKNLDCCGFVYTNFNGRGKSGTIAILGPDRMAYSKIIPIVRYIKNLINEVISSF
ncbi:MAG: hypothetical protein ABIJ36_01020 [Patescibacteria group bacterium]|nr:hypothetical protein [Patescibacteria group bacterium]